MADKDKMPELKVPVDQWIQEIPFDFDAGHPNYLGASYDAVDLLAEKATVPWVKERMKEVQAERGKAKPQE